MSLTQFDVQGSWFKSLGAIAPELFSGNDKYKRFAQKVWPVLARSREELLECYQADNGRAGIEPVVLLGVIIFQFWNGARPGSNTQRWPPSSKADAVVVSGKSCCTGTDTEAG